MSETAERFSSGGEPEPVLGEPRAELDGQRSATPRGMVRVTRAELVWPGKYNEDGTRRETPRVSLPFQIIERVNESRATREAKAATRTLSLFDVYEGSTFEDGWRNKLIWGDNLLVMGSLLEKFAGKIDLIYIDPPFATGADFRFIAEIGEGDTQLLKEHSAVEEKAYRDTWGRGLESFLQMISDRLILMRELLSEKGSLLVHLAPPASDYVKVMLDPIFGSDNFRNEIVLHRPINKNLQRQFTTVRSLPQGHDILLWYSKSPDTRFASLWTEQRVEGDGYWHRFWSGADRPTMRYELLGETPARGQWKWSKARATEAVKNYEKYLELEDGRSLHQYWLDTGMKLRFIRKSKTGSVENWHPPADVKLADTVWDGVKAYEGNNILDSAYRTW